MGIQVNCPEAADGHSSELPAGSSWQTFTLLTPVFMHTQDWRQAGLPKQEKDAMVPSENCRAVSIGTNSTVAGRFSWTRCTSLIASWSEQGCQRRRKSWWWWRSSAARFRC